MGPGAEETNDSDADDGFYFISSAADSTYHSVPSRCA